MTEADGRHPLVLRCAACHAENHPACSGRPDGTWPAVCRCPQCYLRLAEAEWDAARLRQDSQAAWRMRIWGDVFRAARLEARTRKRPKRPRITLPCLECGRPVVMARRDRRGPFCRTDEHGRPSNRCKMRWWRRQATSNSPVIRPEVPSPASQLGQAEVDSPALHAAPGRPESTATASPMQPHQPGTAEPSAATTAAPAADVAPSALDPVRLWAAIHGGG